MGVCSLTDFYGRDMVRESRAEIGTKFSSNLESIEDEGITGVEDRDRVRGAFS